jgi:hypothetical protein
MNCGHLLLRLFNIGGLSSLYREKAQKGEQRHREAYHERPGKEDREEA